MGGAGGTKRIAVHFSTYSIYYKTAIIVVFLEAQIRRRRRRIRMYATYAINRNGSYTWCRFDSMVERGTYRVQTEATGRDRGDLHVCIHIVHPSIVHTL